MIEPDAFLLAQSHIALAVTSLGLSAAQETALHDAHDIACRTTAEGGLRYETMAGVPVLDPQTGRPAVDAAGFLRSVAHSQPHIVGAANAAPDRSKTSSPANSITTAMIAARNGDTSTLDKLMQEQFKPVAKTGSKIQNITEHMRKVRAGEISADDVATIQYF